MSFHARRPCRLSRRAWWCAFAILGSFSCPAAAADCGARGKALTDAARAGRLEQAARLFGEIERSCPGKLLEPLAHNLAVAYGRAAFAGERNAEERVKLLEAGLRFSRPWQLVAALADLEKGRQRFAKAAALYQEALDTISDATCTAGERGAASCREAAPPKAVIAKVYSKAVEARLLAERYVPAPIARNGTPGGLARRSFRGFTPRAVPIPIHFEYAKAEFTAEGRRAVEDMLRYLTGEGSPAIELTGHTDQRGTEAFNLRLSAERAAAVKRFLVERGYKGSIATRGRGEAQPFQADDPGSYTREQRWQLDRRVELARP